LKYLAVFQNNFARFKASSPKGDLCSPNCFCSIPTLNNGIPVYISVTEENIISSNNCCKVHQDNRKRRIMKLNQQTEMLHAWGHTGD
jgi:Zn-finger protein